ncbi:uncharacterized protein A4U43_C08F32720 [Asparagus officinalis]|nr:uncharacterized protein A4U43_C08F32720 [Asparagus officinalis]
MIYLDADIQVYANIDNLFDLPDGSFYAVMDCFCPPPSLYFNAGMFVFEPALSTCDALLEKLKVTEPTPFAEQDFLNMFFRDAYKPIPFEYNLVLAMLWRHPENVDLGRVKVVHYCAAGSKPWRYTGNEPNMDREDIKELVKKWWEIYNDESLDCKGPAVAAVDGGGSVVARGLEPSDLMRRAMSEAGAVRCITAPSAA